MNFDLAPASVVMEFAAPHHAYMLTPLRQNVNAYLMTLETITMATIFGGVVVVGGIGYIASKFNAVPDIRSAMDAGCKQMANEMRGPANRKS